jgi:hypothetical protein
MRRPRVVLAVPVILAGITGATCAQATVRIGHAMLVEHNVSGSLSGQQRKVLKGDDVFENEFIRTEVASTARLLFVDKTQLQLGPTAIAKLDRLVFNPDKSVSALTVSARAGALRWISGESTSSAYQIETPTVTIRVHGTTFDLLIEQQRTTVVLQQGIIEVCLIDAPQRCRILSGPGDMIRATRSALEGPQQGGPGLSDFEDRCLSATSRECSIGASAPPARPSPKPGVGKKRAERTPSKPPKLQAYEPPPPKRSEPSPPKRYEPPPSRVTEVSPPPRVLIIPIVPRVRVPYYPRRTFYPRPSRPMSPSRHY